MASPTVGHIKTCQNCARGKIRCVRAPDSSACERCQRLDKECYFRPARARYNPVKKGTRVEALEAKVDQLLARVVNQHQTIPGVCGIPNPEPKAHPNQDKSQDVIDRGVVSYDDAATILNTFRHKLMPYFPFVLIAPETTLDQLRAEKPFLLLAILKVSLSQNAATQQVFEGAFQSAVADRMIFSHNPSMDVLQGLLIALAWSQHQSENMRFSSYLHLAWSVVGDLRLDRVSETQSFFSRMAVNMVASDLYSTKQSVNDKRRALIGCYILSSCRSTVLQKDRMMTRLSYIEKQAFELLSNAETASDRYLIQLVRLQRIFERIDDAVVNTASSVREADMHGFQTEIDQYKMTLSTEFSDNSLLQFGLHTLQLFLCQACLFDKHETPNQPASSIPRSHSDARLPPHLQSSHQRLDLSPFQVEFLSRGLTGAKEFFDFFFTFTPESYGAINHAQWLHTGFNLVLGCKLAVMGAEYAPRSQHVGDLCSALNMRQVLRGVLHHLARFSKDRVDTEVKQHSKHFYEVWMGHIIEWFEQKYHLVQPEDSPASLSEVPHGGPGPSTFPSASSFQDSSLMGEEYDVAQGAPVYGTGSWPDFLWDISTEDILSGYMGFMDMPYPTLQPGNDMRLS